MLDFLRLALRILFALKVIIIYDFRESVEGSIKHSSALYALTRHSLKKCVNNCSAYANKLSFKAHTQCSVTIARFLDLFPLPMLNLAWH